MKIKEMRVLWEPRFHKRALGNGEPVQRDLNI